ncbi:hypothetical protein BU15DRAFT_17519, partial [Melanogaster broomeanus]
ISCSCCHIIMCMNEACAASLLAPFQTCSRHVSTAACYTCLEPAHRLPPLGKCPDCNLWFCRHELAWCRGRPKLREPGTDFYRLPDAAREHPKKPIGCSSCTGGRDRRCSEFKCWSKQDGYTSLCELYGGYMSVCELCAPCGGLSCMCEQCWICDDCKTTPNPSSFKECPRCRKVYCRYECEYIQYCTECGRPTLCNDCVEEDNTQCGSEDCWGKICGACLETTRCAGCKDTFCSVCTTLQPCKLCNGRFCVSC